MKSTAKSKKNKTVKTGLSCKTHDGQVYAKEKTLRTDISQQPFEGSLQLLPRVVRLKDASGYLGMDRNRFNTEVRPGLVAFPIGKQGIGFDRYDLDAWFDEYKTRNGHPGQLLRGNEPWDVKKYQDLSKGASAGTLTNKSEAAEFAKALAKATSKKQKNS